MVGELTPGDTLSVIFFRADDDYFTLEFLRVEVYYTMKRLTRAALESCACNSTGKAGEGTCSKTPGWLLFDPLSAVSI